MSFKEAPAHEQGDFNSGLGIIYRLDSIHKELHVHRRINLFEEYYHWLIGYYIEILRVITDTEEKEQLKHWSNVKKDYFKLRRLVSNKQPIDATLLESFYYWEIELTKLEQLKGIGMPKKRDARYALSN